MNDISKQIKLGGWDWSRIEDLLKIFKTVTDFFFTFFYLNTDIKKEEKDQSFFDKFLLSFIKLSNKKKTYQNP